MQIEELLKKDDFGEMMMFHAMDIVNYCLDRDIEFSILCNLANVEFVNKLPDEIYATFKPLTLFVLGGYTFESAQINDDNELEFEAGFGKDNFGTVVIVPLNSILQIIINETIVYINLTATITKKSTKSNQGSIERSKNAIFANPENQKLLKKKRI